MRYIFSFLALIFGALAAAAIWHDLADGRDGINDIGTLWFEWAASSLQVTEAVISRYIDPCGLFVSLDCAPFIWHPLISWLLLLPGAVFFTVMTAIFIVIAKYLKRR